MLPTGRNDHHAGVVGVVTPWNYPLLLSVGSLITSSRRESCDDQDVRVHTGNRSSLTRDAREAFAEDQVAVVTDDTGVLAEEFVRCEFDSFGFNGLGSGGSPGDGAAADNLVPVTLELEGNPRHHREGAPLDVAAERICWEKSLKSASPAPLRTMYCVLGAYEQFVEAYRHATRACSPP